MEKVKELEDKVSSWFGAKYGIAVDSCTHGIELCMRLNNVKKLVVPKRTYISIPFLASKLNIQGTSSYVRVSQVKKEAVEKLIENVDHAQVLDFL